MNRFVNRLYRPTASVGIPELAGAPAYAVGILMSVLSAGGKSLLVTNTGIDPGFGVYVPAIAVAAWLGGFRAGLAATVASTLLNQLLFVEGAVLPVAIDDQVRALLFAAGGALIAALSGRLRRSVRAVAEQRTEMARSRDQLQAVLEAASDAITVEDDKARFLFANAEAARLMAAASPEELAAETVSQRADRIELLNESGRPITRDALPGPQLLAGAPRSDGMVVRVRVRATREERLVHIKATPIRDERTGVARLAVNVFRDVTMEQRRQAGDRYVAEATAIVAGMVDEAQGIDDLATLTVRRVADWCSVGVVATGGRSMQTAVARRSSSASAEFGERALTASDRTATTGPWAVIRTGLAQHVPAVSPAAEREILDGLGISEASLSTPVRSYLCAPLMARGRPVGAMTMLMGPSGRQLDGHDLAAGVEIGQRVGVAIAAARLFRTASARGAELNAVLSAMREGVFVYDSNGLLVLANPAAEGLLNAPAPDRLDALSAALELDGSAPIVWSDLLNAEPQELRRDDGTWLELSAYRAERASANGSEPARTSSIVVVRDITEARHAQAARDTFLGLLSHELRTPITTIYGGTRLLERPLAEEQRREIVQDVRAEAERLYRLVEDLLVMTRVGRGGVEIGDEPILLQRLLTSAVGLEESRWPGLTVRFNVPTGLPTVRGDPTYVEQVVRNLLTNAAKYGGVEQPIDLDVKEESGGVSVRVMDRGPGVSQEDADHLFDLFYRATATARTASGAGIGLFVCRALVQAMGGRIWSAPREGGGAEFGFSLPILEHEDDI